MLDDENSQLKEHITGLSKGYTFWYNTGCPD